MLLNLGQALSLSHIYIYTYVSVSVIPNQWKKLVLFSRDNSGLPHGFPFGILQKVPPRARTPTKTSSRSTAADLEKTHLWLIHINLHWSITLFRFGYHHKHPFGTIRVMVQKTWYPDGTPSLVPQVIAGLLWMFLFCIPPKWPYCNGEFDDEPMEIWGLPYLQSRVSPSQWTWLLWLLKSHKFCHEPDSVWFSLQVRSAPLFHSSEEGAGCGAASDGTGVQRITGESWMAIVWGHRQAHVPTFVNLTWKLQREEFSCSSCVCLNR